MSARHLKELTFRLTSSIGLIGGRIVIGSSHSTPLCGGSCVINRILFQRSSPCSKPRPTDRCHLHTAAAPPPSCGHGLLSHVPWRLLAKAAEDLELRDSIFVDLFVNGVSAPLVFLPRSWTNGGEIMERNTTHDARCTRSSSGGTPEGTRGQRIAAEPCSGGNRGSNRGSENHQPTGGRSKSQYGEENNGAHGDMEEISGVEDTSLGWRVSDAMGTSIRGTFCNECGRVGRTIASFVRSTVNNYPRRKMRRNH